MVGSPFLTVAEEFDKVFRAGQRGASIYVPDLVHMLKRLDEEFDKQGQAITEELQAITEEFIRDTNENSKFMDQQRPGE